jgi:hypothetical protein
LQNLTLNRNRAGLGCHHRTNDLKPTANQLLKLLATAPIFLMGDGIE